jgi:hypothetical protein
MKLNKSHKYAQYIWTWFSRNSNILKFLLSPVRSTKCLGVCVPLRPPRKKALALLIVNLGTRRWWVVSTTPRPPLPPGMTRYPLYRRLCRPQATWAPVPVWTCVKNLAPTGIRSPDHPVRSQATH